MPCRQFPLLYPCKKPIFRVRITQTKLLGIMKKLLLTAGLLASLSAAAYEGRVYVDGNQNGRYDAGERVLSGVCVSDGLHVTRTDRIGA